MPTTKPRITITLSEHQHELLGAMADAQKVSMSSIVVELLDTAVPVLERVMELINAAKRAPKEAIEELKRSLDRAEEGIIGMQAQALGQLDLLVKEAGDMGGTRSGRPVAAASVTQLPAVKRPPSSNRGVRITPTSQISDAKKATSKATKGVLLIPKGCTCTITKHERMENKTCPVHFPAKRRSHAV